MWARRRQKLQQYKITSSWRSTRRNKRQRLQGQGRVLTTSGLHKRRKGTSTQVTTVQSIFFLSLRVGRLYLEKGYAFLKTNLENCPPENTVKGWGVKCVLGGIPTRPGRPGHLTCREEILLAAAVRDLRGGGACIDRESLIFLGHETVREVCYFF